MEKSFDEWLAEQSDNIKLASVAYQHSCYAWDHSPLRNTPSRDVRGPLPITIKDFEHYEWWRIFYRRDHYRTY